MLLLCPRPTNELLAEPSKRLTREVFTISPLSVMPAALTSTSNLPNSSFATATALIDVVTNANDKKVFTYFENALDFFKECYPTPEFSIFFVRQCTEKRSELIDTDSYSAFKLANRDLEY